MAKLLGSVYFSGRCGSGGNSSLKATAASLEARPTATVNNGSTSAPMVVSEEDAEKGGALAGASRSTTSRGASNVGSATVQPATPQNSSQTLKQDQTQMKQMRSGSGPKKSGLDQGQQAVVPDYASTTGGPVPTHQQGSGSSGSLSSLSSVAPAPGFRAGPGSGLGLGFGRRGSAPSATATTGTATITTSSDPRSGSNSSSSSMGNSRSSSKLSLTGGGSTNDAAIRAAASATKTKLAKRVEDQHAHVVEVHFQQEPDANADAEAGDIHAASAFAATGGQAHVDDADDDVDDGNPDEETILTEIEQGILDVFSDVYLNKHLIYSILELILVRLMPELAEKRVSELWEERLV